MGFLSSKDKKVKYSLKTSHWYSSSKVLNVLDIIYKLLMNKQDIHFSVSGWMASPLHKKKQNNNKQQIGREQKEPAN